MLAGCRPRDVRRSSGSAQVCAATSAADAAAAAAAAAVAIECDASRGVHT